MYSRSSSQMLSLPCHLIFSKPFHCSSWTKLLLIRARLIFRIWSRILFRKLNLRIWIPYKWAKIRFSCRILRETSQTIFWTNYKTHNALIWWIIWMTHNSLGIITNLNSILSLSKAPTLKLFPFNKILLNGGRLHHFKMNFNSVKSFRWKVITANNIRLKPEMATSWPCSEWWINKLPRNQEAKCQQSCCSMV